MLGFRKSVRFILLTTVPGLAFAQAPPVQPAPQSTPIANVAPASMSGNVSAPEGTATVNYVRGQLTVISHNASLDQVLKLVAAKTGATVGLAPELQNEPVVAQIGPGTVHEVITRLLDSPKIDYIVLGKGDDPDNLLRIVVQSRHAQSPGATQAYRPPQPPQEDEDTRAANGNLSEDESHMSQEDLRERWRKIREEKLAAELRQQKEDREREANGSANDAEQQPQNVQQPQPPQTQDTRPQ